MSTLNFKHERNILIGHGDIYRRVGKLTQVFKNGKHDFYFETPYSTTDPHQGKIDHLSLHDSGMSHIKFFDQGMDILHSKANALAFKEIGYASYFYMEFKIEILPIEATKTEADIGLEWKSDKEFSWLIAHFVDGAFAINNKIGFGALLHDQALVPVFNASLVDTKAIAVGGTSETSKTAFVVQCGYKDTVEREDKILFQPIKGQYKKDYLLPTASN
jgi:hypothetical protein